MDREDLDLFDRSVRAAVATDDVDGALADLGWADALSVETEDAVRVLFGAQGEANATSAGLDHVLRHALGVDASVLLPWLGGAEPPAGRGLTRGQPGELVLVARTGGKDVASLVPTSALALRAVDGIDPGLGLVEVTGTASGTEIGPVDWEGAVRLARVALGHELVGASRTMLELARTHALEREQFGQPIAAFQAVRHRLAETLVATEMAEAMLDAAWLDGTVLTAGMAKAVAGRSARTAARHCQQVLAGIGFTTEHDFHLYLRRILVLDELFGSARVLTRQLGEDLLRTRQLPPLLPL